MSKYVFGRIYDECSSDVLAIDSVNRLSTYSFIYIHVEEQMQLRKCSKLRTDTWADIQRQRPIARMMYKSFALFRVKFLCVYM